MVRTNAIWTAIGTDISASHATIGSTNSVERQNKVLPCKTSEKEKAFGK